MVDGVNGATGGYGTYGYGYGRNTNASRGEEKQPEAIQNNYNETQVDPGKVMDFLSNHNYFMPVQKSGEVNVNGVEDPALNDRVAGYLEQFEMIYGIVLEEFGEELAPAVMDVVMDKLIGMADTNF